MKAKILFALSALLMLGSASLNAQEVGNSSNNESTTQLEGDLNHDNKVDVADVTYLVNIIMNQSTSEDIPVTSVSVSPTSATINVNGTQQLSATVSPSDATNKSVTWSSSNTSVATVSSSGLVTGVSAGNATITVKTNDGNKTATSTITVQQSQPQPSSDYYWYVGVENPTSIPTSDIQTDNTKPGWHLIGSSLSGFSYDTNSVTNEIQLGTKRVIYNIIIPNDLHIYAADNTTNVEHIYFNDLECHISGYKAFRSIPSDDFPEGDRSVTGIIIR